jgi:hypothetical protein
MPRHVRKSYTPRICVKCGTDARDIAYLRYASTSLGMTPEDAVYTIHRSTGDFVCTVCAYGPGSVAMCITVDLVKCYKREVLQMHRELRERYALEARTMLERC